MNHNTDYKIIRLNSDDAYSNEDLTTLTNYDGDYDHRLTYYFKNPIVLPEEYELSIHSFTTNKIRNGNTIYYPTETFGINSFYNYNTSVDEIIPETINQEIIEQTISGVRIWDFDTQSQSFYPRDAYITIRIEKEADGTGYIYFQSVDTRGTDFAVGDYINIDKQELVDKTGNYTFNPAYRYAGFDVDTLNGDSEIKDVSIDATGNQTILSYATGQPITEGTFYNVPLYIPDGDGWYDYAGVRATARVVSTTGTNYGRVLIDEITIGGSGFSLADKVYLDKLPLVENVYPNTYSASARFASYNVSALVKGIGNLITPPNSITQEILPNPTTLAFANTTETDVPFLKLVAGDYVETGATGIVSVLKNPDPAVNGKATLQSITNAGSGFSVDDTLYIDKAFLTKDDNDYDRTIPAERYINFQVQSLTSSAGLGNVEVVNITNYGFDYTPLGNYTWEDPYSSIKITFELYDPPTETKQVRILSVEGTGYEYSVGQYEIPNSQVVEQATGVVGWSKQYGNLKIEITSNYPISYDKIIYKVALENILYNNMLYKNSDNDGHPVILLTDVSKSTIDLYNQVLTLTPQIITELKVLVKQPILQGENIDISLLLQKKSLIF
jgi:hypothetical protein